VQPLAQPSSRFAISSSTFPLRRWLAPSLSDWFFLFVTAWMFLASPAGWDRLLLDTDTALHIRTGQHILATGTVPTHDLFSFSKPGETWYALEWGSEALFAWIFGAGGLKAVVLLSGAMIALLVTMLLKHSLWKGANGVIALVVTLLAATAISIQYFARPHLFTLLFLAVTSWVMDDYRRRGGRLLWTLVPLTVVWANLHPGFLVFLLLLGLRVLGCVIEGWLWPDLRRERTREAIHLAAAGAACGIASLANPYGIHFHIDILRALRTPWVAAHAKEFLSPTFRSEEAFDFMFLLFAALVTIGPLARKRKIVEPLWILFLAYCSLVAVRHIAIFALIIAPIIAAETSEWWAAAAARWPRKSVPGMLDDISRQFTERLPGTSLFIPIVIAVLAIAPGLRWPTEFPEGGVPIKMIDQRLDWFANHRVYASDQMAGYLLFRNFPRQKVFFDTRHYYYGEQIGDEYLTINDGGPRWRSLIEQYRFDAVLCAVDAPLASLIQAAGGWRVIENNGKFILFELNTRPQK
jgi:hypothetical protein